MPPTSAPVTYDKKPGTLTVSNDGKLTTWTANGEKQPAVKLDITIISRIQRSKATSAKISLRILEFVPETKTEKDYTFRFSSDDSGRSNAEALENALTAALQKKGAAAMPVAPAASQGKPKADGAPAAMAIAAAVSAGGPASSRSELDDAKLLADQGLQQKLLMSNKDLSSVFTESMKARPESITPAAFHRQFWTSRIKILRAFAIQQSQKKGDYNVLSTVKTRMEGEELKLSVTGEQVTLILNQYPVVRKARTLLTPGINDNEFWTRFFKSRLFKKLKGEKITEADKKDELLDKFLDTNDDDLEREQRLLASHVPHTIDLAGNEQDNSQRQGNAPDRDNRPSAPERVPIMRALNALSERLVSQVAPNDVDPSAPIGVDEATFKEMELRDLAAETEAQRMILNIRDKAKFFATGKGTSESQGKRLYSKQNPQIILKNLKADLKDAEASNLAESIGVADSDSDDEMEDGGQPRKTHVGSKSSRRSAAQQVFSSVHDRRARANEQLASTDETDIAEELGLTLSTYHNITLSQAAANVFLSHFWSVFHSGNSARALELGGVTEALAQMFEGIKAAGDAAEKERRKKIDEMKDMYRAHAQRTGKQQKLDTESIKGGRKVIEQLMASTKRSIQFALDTYSKALEVAREEEARNL